MSNEQMAMMNPEHEVVLSDSGDLLKLAQLNTMNINGLSKQMGLMNERMDTIVQRVDGHENRLDVLEHDITINRAQIRRIKKSVMSRVNYLLKIEFDGGKVAESSIADDVRYRGPFVTRCYADAKNHSKMGESYPETLKVDFGEVIDYIESWVPEVDGGVEGYKHYLDIRREERSKDNA